jgi:transcriptional regulator with XRE-family HTH domain
MKYSEISDNAILAEIGDRIQKQRLNQNVTQIEVAEKAGVARSVVQKIERGEDVMFLGLIRVLRALGLLDQLDTFLPDPGISPLQLVRQQMQPRQRASGDRSIAREKETDK